MDPNIYYRTQKKLLKGTFKSNNLFGAQSRNRTSDTWIFSPLLYRLSYLGLYVKKWWAFRDLNPGPAGYEPDALTN